MNFLFINLNWSRLVSKKTFKLHFTVPPLDLILLCNLARQGGHEAELLDLFVDDAARLEELKSKADWIVITTTPYHMWQCPNADWDFIKKGLASFPAEKTILVGLHGSVFPEDTLRQTGVHAVIRREPEVVFRDFLQKKRWHACGGVSYLEGDKLQEFPTPALPSMDELVVTDYCVDISKYGYFLLGPKTGVFEASRGCPWKCTFCDQEMYSWKYRQKSPAVFASEVKRGIEQTGMETAYFFDLEFTVHKKRTLEICEELVKAGIPGKLRWACQTRADTVDEEILAAMKAAGCVLIHYGVESANPEVLRRTNKKITLAEIEKGVLATKRMGIQTACFFMFGLPGEKEEEFGNTLEFARRISPTYASFHFAIPFPGTPMYEEYIELKGLPSGSWPRVFYDQWDAKRISSYIAKSFLKYYLWPKKIEVQEIRFRLRNLRPKPRYFMSALRA